MFISGLAVICYLCLVVNCTRYIIDKLNGEMLSWQEVIQNELSELQHQKELLSQEKLEYVSKAFEIFTLFDMVKEITKSRNQDMAFDIFKQKLAGHIPFEECLLVDSVRSEEEMARQYHDYFVFPLKSKRRKIAYLMIKGLLDLDKEKAMILGHQFALVLRRVKLYQAIERIAITDSLTELFTRRYVLERMNEEIKRSGLRKLKMAFLMLDVDRFKLINDQYGHFTGDHVLREVGRIIRENIREIDIAGRYGGEEFCVVLPDTDIDGALFVANRIRESASDSVINAYGYRIQISMSIGVACYPQNAQRGHELVDKADWCLYRAKKLGRNKVCAYGVYE